MTPKQKKEKILKNLIVDVTDAVNDVAVMMQGGDNSLALVSSKRYLQWARKELEAALTKL